jgi:hypothetical protein
VSGQLHAPADLPPGKDPPVPTGYGAGWTSEPVWTRWRRENRSLPSHPIRSLLTILTELSRLLYGVKPIDPEDEGSRVLRNVDILPQNYTASQPRRIPLKAMNTAEKTFSLAQLKLAMCNQYRSESNGAGIGIYQMLCRHLTIIYTNSSPINCTNQWLGGRDRI